MRFGKPNKHESATISAIVIANDVTSKRQMTNDLKMRIVESATVSIIIGVVHLFICSLIRRESMVAWTRVWILLLALVARSAVYCIDRM